MLRSDLCDYSDAYIVVKGTMDLVAAATNENDKAEKNVAFKNKTLFRSCFSKINNTLIDNAENLDIVMLMCSLLEYSQNNSGISGSLWNYYRDKIDNINDNVSGGKSFKYKTEIVGKLQIDQLLTLNVEVTIPLKYLSNVWRFLDLPLINFEIELDLSRTKDYHQKYYKLINIDLSRQANMSIPQQINFVDEIRRR